MKKRKDSLSIRVMAVLLAVVLVAGMTVNAAPASVLSQEETQESVSGNAVETPEGDITPEEGTEPAEEETEPGIEEETGQDTDSEDAAEGEGTGILQALLARIAALPDAEGYLAAEADADAYEEWLAELYAHAEEALAIQEAAAELSEEERAEIPEEALAKLAAWAEAAQTAGESAQVMAADAAPASASAQAEITAGGESEGWILYNDGRLIIRSDAGMTDWSINTQKYKWQVISVEIKDGVASIGDRAFWGCSSLESITIPESVTSIGDRAFSQCENLTSITILGNMENIGAHAFSYCSGLKSITIPESVTSIGENAFMSCSSLENITIPESVTSIEKYTFWGCRSLENITIPKSVTSIGENAFTSCRSLESITIPESVTNIGTYAFSSCSGLTKITIPESVTNIGSDAFSSCKSLTEVIMESEIPPMIESYVFYGDKFVTDKTKGIHVPDGRAQAYKEAWTDWAAYIADDAASADTNIASGNGWTLDATGKLTIMSNDGMTDWCAHTDSYKEQVISVEIKDDVTSIGNSAFERCENLMSIGIPESVTSIGYNAFMLCKNLKSITIPEGVTSIGYNAFYSCWSLTSIEIPEGVTSIGSGTFEGSDKLTSIEIPEGVTNIGNRAFAGCYGLTSIEIPEGVTDIGSQAFQSCKSLTEVNVVGKTPPTLASDVFNNCKFVMDNTKGIHVPDGSAQAYKAAWTEWVPYIADDAASAEPHKHPVCGESCGHSGMQHSDVEWKALTYKEGKLYADGEEIRWYGGGYRLDGNYYLADNLTIDNEKANIQIQDANVYLCLNGKELNLGETSIWIYGEGELTLCDCAGNGLMKSEQQAAVSLANITIGKRAFLMYGGLLQGSEYDFYSGGDKEAEAKFLGGTVTNMKVMLPNGYNTGGFTTPIFIGQPVKPGTKIKVDFSWDEYDGELPTVPVVKAGEGYTLTETDLANLDIEVIASGYTDTKFQKKIENGVIVLYQPVAEKHEHNEVTFTAWTETDCLPTDAGNYYLTENVTLSETWNVPNGTTRLCLNGKTVSISGESRLVFISVSDTMDLYDCQNSGKVTGKARQAGIWNEGTFNMYGGKICGNSSTGNGGGVYNREGTFWMYGGEISGNRALYGSGGVYVAGGTFYMCGGNINNNEGNSGSVAISTGRFFVGGDAVISGNTYNGAAKNVYLKDGQTIEIYTAIPLSGSASIGVTTQIAPTDGNPVSVTGHNKGDYSSYFTSDNPDYVIVNKSDVVQLTVKSKNSVTFKYTDNTATSVYVAGDFNSWATNSDEWKMTKNSSGEWELTKAIDSGVYGYMLVVDGAWKNDPANNTYYPGGTYSKLVVPGTVQSPVISGDSVTFNYPVSQIADDVTAVKVKGSFNGWAEEEMKLSGDGSHYTITISGLAPNTYDYVINVYTQSGPSYGTAYKDYYNMEAVTLGGNSIFTIQAVTTLKDGNDLIESRKPTEQLTGVYGQKLSDITFDDTAWTWTDEHTALSVGEQCYPACFDTSQYEKEYDFSAVEGYDSERHCVEVDLTVNVAKADTKLTIATDNMNKEYDGNAVSNPNVTKTGSTNDVKFTWFKANNDGWELLDEAPVNIGSYKVVASVAGDSNYNGAETEKAFEISGHSYDTSAWGYQGTDGHARKCKNCDAHDAVQAHTPGAAATATTPQTCTVCGYELAPATGIQPGTVTPEVQPGANAPATNFSTPAAELKDMLLTEEEKQQVQSGTDIKIILEVKDANDTVKPADQEAVKGALAVEPSRKYAVGQYLDVSLFKVVGESKSAITETKKKLAIVIRVPENLKGTAGKARTFAVVRVHNGRAELLEDTDDKPDTITIETDRFSAYAIVYQEEGTAVDPTPGPGPAPGPIPTPTPVPTPTPTPAGPASEKKQRNIELHSGVRAVQRGDSLQVSWGGVSGADGYCVYVQYCGKKFTPESMSLVVGGSLTGISIQRINGRALDTARNYKIKIVAYQWRGGEKHILAKSLILHVAGQDSAAYSNVKAVHAEENAYELKTGESVTLRPSAVLYDADRERLPDGHAKEYRFKSSNNKVATVSADGTVTANGVGSCEIYIFAQNGCNVKLEVTVTG